MDSREGHELKPVHHAAEFGLEFCDPVWTEFLRPRRCRGPGVQASDQRSRGGGGRGVQRLPGPEERGGVRVRGRSHEPVRAPPRIQVRHLKRMAEHQGSDHGTSNAAHSGSPASNSPNSPIVFLTTGRDSCPSRASWSLKISMAMNALGSMTSRPMSKLTTPSNGRLATTISRNSSIALFDFPFRHLTLNRPTIIDM